MDTDFKQLFNGTPEEAVNFLENIFNKMSEKEKALGHEGLSKGYETSAFMIKLHARWLKTVGPYVAKHIQPLTVKGNCLILVADNPAYAQEFTFMKDQILKKLTTDPEFAEITAIKTRFQTTREKI